MSRFYPSKDEFIKRAEKFNLIPVYAEIVTDMETPVSAYKKFSGHIDGNMFLLESVEGGEKWGRYSFIGFSPIAILKSFGEDLIIQVGGEEKKVRSRDPLLELKNLMSRFTYFLPDGFPRLSCGAVGYIGYDYVRFIEKLPENTMKKHTYPDLFFTIPSIVIVFDNLTQKTKIIKNIHLEKGKGTGEKYEQAIREISNIVTLISTSIDLGEAGYEREKEVDVDLDPLLSDEKLADIIRGTKRYIREGEAIQVVVSNKYKGKFDGDPFDVYRALRVINPSPYMFYLEADGVRVAGSSPEVLVRLDWDNVILRPIAGTRPRGKSEEEDSRFEAELLSDPKELSEHLMLVDLGRNDLGRIGKGGSVKVNEFMVIEKYSHVMHIVSNITSRLSENRDAFDVMRATFPAGTVTGAPKIRAMEIIEEFEGEMRGIYAGAVGYFDFSGNMDFCIAIRTLIFEESTVIIQAGAGIVFDSDPFREIEEIENKTKALKEAVFRGLRDDRSDR
jgi:anthranilate synthase component 1